MPRTSIVIFVAEHLILTYIISSPAVSTCSNIYHPTGSIVEIEAKTSTGTTSLRRQDVLHGDGMRNLQGGPKHPDLSITSTDGGTIKATAQFFQGGDRYIRVFTNDCETKFDPDVKFTVGGSPSSESEWTKKGSAEEKVDFVIPLKHLNDHLDNNDGGKVAVCIQLETVNTFTNTQVTVELDLTHSATAVSVEAKQPDAIDLDPVNVETKVDAWVCAGDDADPDFNDTPISSLEVPGKIYVCIEVTDGYAIRSGKLVADADHTAVEDKVIDNYMSIAVKGETGKYNEEDTIQILKSNLIRVSIMGDRKWAPVLASTTLKITIDAYFEPDAGRRLASPRHLKFQPGSLRIRKQEFASASTTVELRAASDAGPQLTSGAGPQLTSGAGPTPTSGSIPDDSTPTNESKTNIALIAGAAGAGAFVVVAVAFLLVSRKRRQNDEDNEKAITALDTTDKGSLDSTSRSSIRSSISSSNGSDHDTSRSSASNSRISGNPHARGPPRRPPQDSQRDPPRRPQQGSRRGPPRRSPQGPPRGPPRRTDGSIPTSAPRNASPRRPNGPPRGPNNRPRGPVPANGGRVAPPRRHNGNAPRPSQGHLRPKTPPPY